MSLRFPNGAFSRDKTFSRDKLDAVVMSLDRAIHELELTKIDWLQQVTLFNTNALKRVADAVQPIFEQLQTAVEGGFLVAATNDLVEIVEGEQVSFFIPEAARIAYRPTPFLAILAPDEREDWAIGRLLVYNEVSGLLTVEILHLNGSGAARTGWTIAASSGVVEAVYQWMTDVTTARDQVIAAREEIETLAEDVQAAAILIAGGPVSSIDGETGAVTGIARTVDHYTKTAADDLLEEKADATATALALNQKADSADVATAVAGAQAAATELQKDFVASGAITANQMVALRSDGKVEVISGTETLFSVGADNTELTAANEFVLMDAVWHAGSSTLAVFYYNDTTTDDLLLVLGTVSDGTIDFATPVTIASGAGYGNGKIAWNAAGTLIFAFYIGASSQGWVRGCSVSGTTLTLGGAANNVVATTTPRAIFIDESLSYVVCLGSLTYGAASYSGANVSSGIGAQNFTLTGQTNPKSFYDATNHRLVSMGYNSTTFYAIAFVIAAGAVTNGTEVSQSTAVLLDAAMQSDGKVLAVCASSGSGGLAAGYVLTFATAATTINAGVAFGATISALGPAVGGRAHVVYNSTLGKFIIGMAIATSNVQNVTANVYLTVATISGTSFTLTSFSLLYSRGYPSKPWRLLANSAGTEVALVVTDELDGGRTHVITAKTVSGAWVVTHDDRVRSTIPTANANTGKVQYLQAGWGLFDLGNWSQTTGLSGYVFTTFVVSYITLPTETTNADDWIGQAKETVADGANVTVMLPGGLASGLSGLTAKTPYFLKGDGTLVATDNGRPAGLALSATELLMEAA